MGAELEQRRFNDQEFALILRRAQELQEGVGEAGRAEPRGGLSLADISQIAAEVGIEPRFIELAAQGLSAPSSGTLAILGASYEWDVQRVVPGELPEEEKGRVLDAIRTVVKDKGELVTAYGRVEWTYDDQLGPVQVRIVPDRGETRVEVSARRAGEVGLWYGVPVPVGTMVIGGTIAGLLGLDGPAQVLPVVGLTAAGVGTLVRALWRARAQWWRERVAKLSDRVVEAVSKGVSGAERIP